MKEDGEEDLPCINMGEEEAESLIPSPPATANSQLPRLLQCDSHPPRGDSQRPRGDSHPPKGDTHLSKVEGDNQLPIVLDEDSIVPLPADHDDSFRYVTTYGSYRE